MEAQARQTGTLRGRRTDLAAVLLNFSRVRISALIAINYDIYVARHRFSVILSLVSQTIFSSARRIREAG
jgi:hypothetical protein